MQTTEEISNASFKDQLAGTQSTLAEVLLGSGRRDRLGIIVDQPGGNGASTLAPATVTAFYDLHRRRSSDF